MKRRLQPVVIVMSIVALANSILAQQAPSVIPTLVNFSGTLTDANSKPLTGTVGLTFCFYNDQQGGSPLWIETQNIQPDRNGHYTVQLGATSSEGLPTNLFASGEARWLGVQAQGQPEQPRVMLLAVPYALKAGDAATVGGLPPSAFVLAAPSGNSNTTTNSPSNPSPSGGPNVSGSGTQNYIPIWTDSSGDLGDSILYQMGSGSSAKLGLNIKTPLASLDINGTGLIRGLFELATTGFASSGKAYNSNPLNFESSAFNSATKKYALNHFQWQSEPTGNNTNNPSATLNLLYGTDPSNPSETGLNIASNGQITFAKGQAFPGAGTISGVTAGTGLTGGGSSGNVTLNVDTTKVPLLAAANTFTAVQTINTTANTNSLVISNTSGAAGIYSVALGGGVFGATMSSTTLGGVEGVDQSSTGAGGGVYGYSPNGYGVSGVSPNGNGVVGTSTAGVGIYGGSSTGTAGYFQGNVQMTGLITNYNGLQTYGNGVPSVMYKYQDFSFGSGTSGYITLYTPSNDGVFRLMIFQECTGTSGGGTYFAPSFAWTIPTGGAGGYGDVGGPDCSGLNYFSESFILHVKGGTAIQMEYPGMNAPFQNLVLIEQLL
jgi:trimeric autotransporter adhesin